MILLTIKPWHLSPIAFALLLQGCGGGGGSSSGGGGLAGIDGSGSPASVSAGPITGFGSILQNGKRYIVESSTVISVDGVSLSSNDLQVGQYVVIISSDSDDDGNPIADQVISEVVLRGQVTAVDIAGDSLTALNQTVAISSGTIIDEDDFAGDFTNIAVNDYIEVTGTFDGSGTITATRIESKSASAEVKLAGVVSNLDSSAGTFEIGGQVVDYNSAELDEDFAGSISNGDIVKVEGNLNGSDEIVATEVETYGDAFDELENESEFEVKGAISDFVSSTDFKINGVAITTDSGTEFDGGTSGQLANGVVVEVDGEWDGSALVADEVSFEQEDTIKIEAQIEALDITSGTLNQGTITLLGIDVSLTTATSFEDKSDEDLENFGLDDLSVGDYVELEGFVSGSSVVISDLERDDFDGDYLLQGPVDSFTTSVSITILGITIDDSLVVEYKDADDNTVSASTFYGAISAGTIVKVQGTESGGTFGNDLELSIENED